MIVSRSWNLAKIRRRGARARARARMRSDLWRCARIRGWASEDKNFPALGYECPISVRVPEVRSTGFVVAIICEIFLGAKKRNDSACLTRARRWVIANQFLAQIYSAPPINIFRRRFLRFDWHFVRGIHTRLPLRADNYSAVGQSMIYRRISDKENAKVRFCRRSEGGIVGSRKYETLAGANLL